MEIEPSHWSIARYNEFFAKKKNKSQEKEKEKEMEKVSPPTFLAEYPMPKEELSFFVGGMGADGENERYIPPPTHYTFRPNTRLIQKDWYPTALVESEEYKNTDDRLWLKEMGVDDVETLDYVLSAPKRNSLEGADCWRLAEDFKRCRLKNKKNKRVCNYALSKSESYERIDWKCRFIWRKMNFTLLPKVSRVLFHNFPQIFRMRFKPIKSKPIFKN